MLDTLISYFDQYGYLVVFFGVMLENAGVPLPGETILLAAGFRASQGPFHLWEVMAIAAVGAVLGDNAGYWIGHKLGRTALERYGRYVGLTHSRVVRMDEFFSSHGDKTILVARFITGLRVFAALLAGASRMAWRRFALFNFLGAVLWSFVISLAGFFFGRSWDLLEKWIKGAGLIMLGIVVAAVITLAVLRRRRKREADLKAEADA